MCTDWILTIYNKKYNFNITPKYVMVNGEPLKNSM